EKGIITFIFGLCFSGGILLTAIISGHIKKIGDKYQCYTVSDYLAIRYSNKCKIAGGIIYFFVSLFLMAAQFVALSTFIHILLGWSILLSTIVSALIIIVYTSISGIKGVFYTDFIQFIILSSIFIFVLVPLIINKSGGFVSLKALPPSYFKLTSKDILFIIGAFIFLVPSISMGMDLWQRIFAADSVKTARNSMIIAALISIPFFAVITLIGMFSKILLPGIVPKMASVKIALSVLPKGLLGLCLAAFMSALMSTADSMLMVASTVLLKDFYPFLKKKDSPLLIKKNSTQNIKHVRFVTFFVGVIGLLVALAIPNIFNLIVMAISYLSILLPSIIGGFFWKRSNSKAAFYSITIGFISALILIFKIPRFAFIPATLLSIIIFISFSFIFKNSPEEKIALL
ncbi:MAG: hypothetical protein KAS39_05485, partial [Actinomycetia bacterium]|nr:hypothetical protein [Actinomycetes bacterium]